jgi:hypothetical protein
MRAPRSRAAGAFALALAVSAVVHLAPPSPARAAYTADRLPPVPAVVGYRRAYALQDGVLKGWGFNAGGELGDGAPGVLSQPNPQPIVGLTNVKQVAHSFTHAIALKDDGTVWTWGNNGKGQLGRTGSTKVPAQVPGLAGATWVEAGNETSFAVVGGKIYAWGVNDSGQLGLGDKVNRAAPTLIASPTGIKTVRAGYVHTLATTTGGAVYAWGSNYSGQLGNGTTVDALKPTLVGGLTRIVAVAAGIDHSLALDAARQVWTWGDDERGQLGNDAAWSPIATKPVKVLTGAVAIAAGMFHSVALRSTAEVWSWGAGDNGQLGDAGTADVFVPKKSALKEPALYISAGYYGTGAVTRHGQLWVWGWNGYGQYGNGTTDGSATGGNFGVPTLSKHQFTYDVLLLAVSKANTGHIADMKANLPILADHMKRLSYDKVRLKVDAAANTYFATAADLGCTGDLNHDEYAILNFGLAKAKAEGFVLSRYHHVVTQFDYDLVSSFGCDKPGASGGMVNAPNQAVTIPLLAANTGWLSEGLQGVVGVHELEHGYGLGGLRPHTGQLTCNGVTPFVEWGGACAFDDDAPNNMYALGDGFVPSIPESTDFNENVAYKAAWQWIAPGRVESHASTTPGSFTVTLVPSDEPALADTGVATATVPLPTLNTATRALYLEYRLHARIGNAPTNANKPGVYAIYYQTDQAYLMKVGTPDPNTFNGHKPLPVGLQSVLDPKVRVTVVNVTATAATVKIDILP